MGLRVSPGADGDGGRPICVTRLYLNPVLKGIEGKLRGRKGAVYALIEGEYGIGIERVEQELQAVLLAADDAANLGTEAGAAACASCAAITTTAAACSRWPRTSTRPTASATGCSCASRSRLDSPATSSERLSAQ